MLESLSKILLMGDQQVYSINLFDINSPIISWTTDRILLCLSVIFSLDSTQVFMHQLHHA